MLLLAFLFLHLLKMPVFFLSFILFPHNSKNDPAGVEGLEPPTPGFGDQCSGQLSYTPNRNFTIWFLYEQYGSYNADNIFYTRPDLYEAFYSL
jgi:hypothetical protein